MISRSLTVWRAASRLLKMMPKYYYQNQKSMISNMQSVLNSKKFVQYYKIIQQSAIPRTLAIASRKLAFFCLVNDPTNLPDQFHQYMHKFYTRILNIQCTLLSPTECHNIIYFLRSSQKQWEYLDFKLQHINQKRFQLLNHCMQYSEHLAFNGACDLLQQFKKLSKNHQINRPKDQATLYKICEANFPSNQQQKQIDSLFHLLVLYRILSQQKNDARPKKLFISTCQKIIKLVNYLHLAPLLKLINFNVAEFDNQGLTNQQRLMRNSAFCAILNRICQIIQLQEEPTYQDVSNNLRGYVKDLQSQASDTEQTILGIILQTNRLLKINKTSAQIKKQQKALQMLKINEQNYQIYLLQKEMQEHAIQARESQQTLQNDTQGETSYISNTSKPKQSRKKIKSESQRTAQNRLQRID